MPVRCDGTTSSYINLTATGAPSPTAYTTLFWMQVVNANAGANRLFFVMSNSGVNHGLWRPSSDNDGVRIDGSAVTDMSGNEDESSWYMWAISASGSGASDGKAYAWKLGDPDGTYLSATFQPSSFTPNEIFVGGTYYATGRDARIAYVKVWDAALSLAELQAERVQGKPVRTTSINRYHRLQTSADTTDYSGNGRSATMTGVSTEGSEPVQWEAAAEGDIFYRPRRTIFVPRITLG